MGTQPAPLLGPQAAPAGPLETPSQQHKLRVHPGSGRTVPGAALPPTARLLAIRSLRSGEQREASADGRPRHPKEGPLGVALSSWMSPTLSCGALAQKPHWAGGTGPALLRPRTGGACLSGSVLPGLAAPPHNGALSPGWAGRRCPLPAARPLTRAPLCGCGCGQQVAAWSRTGRPCRQPRERRRAPRVLAGWGPAWAGLGQGVALTERGLQHERTILPTPAPPAWPGQHVARRPSPRCRPGASAQLHPGLGC